MLNIRNILIGSVAVAIIAGIVVSCGGGGSDPYGGGGGTPPVMSGTGRGALVVDATTRDITGSFSFKGLSGTPTSAGIYVAPAGQNTANALIPLTIDRLTAFVSAGTAALTPAQLTDLQAGNFYFLVKTSTFPNGEIRGQITNSANLTAGLAPVINGAQAGVMTLATGAGVFVVDSSTRVILAGVATYANLPSPVSMAHIHRTSDNGVRVDFLPPQQTLATPTDPDTPIGTTDLTDFTNGNLYFNVHTNDYPGGEIRGAIVPTTTQIVRSASLTTGQVIP